MGGRDAIEAPLSGSADVACLAGVDLLRGVAAEPAVMVFGGVAVQELGDPFASVLDGIEPLGVG